MTDQQLPHDVNPREERLANGKDEMNLAELPFAALRRVSDNRKAIIHEGWTVDEKGNRVQQRWVVTGDSLLGLPTEYDERVLIALFAITARQGFASPKVSFSIYQILKIMGIARSQKAYQDVESALARLVRVTFESTNAFWDNARHERVTTSEAFHLLERYWLRTKESSDAVRDQEDGRAYIVWSERFWTSFTANYLKNLDLDFFYSLSTPTARRLYRFLDKRLQFQTAYELDIFELSSRLGMVRYTKPVKVRQTLQPAIDELIGRGYLLKAEVVKHQSGNKTYTRMRFVRAEPGKLTASARAAAAKEDMVLDGETGGLVARLMEHGIGRTQAEDLVRRFPATHVEEKLDLLEWKMSGGGRGRRIKDQSAWLVTAILKDYQPPAGFHAWRERREMIDQPALFGLLEDPTESAREAEPHARSWEEWVIAQYDVSESAQRLTVQLQKDLQHRLPRATFDQWGAHLMILSVDDDRVRIAVPTRPAHEWLTGRLRRPFETVLPFLVEGAGEIEFILAERGEEVDDLVRAEDENSA